MQSLRGLKWELHTIRMPTVNGQRPPVLRPWSDPRPSRTVVPPNSQPPAQAHARTHSKPDARTAGAADGARIPPLGPAKITIDAVAQLKPDASCESGSDGTMGTVPGNANGLKLTQVPYFPVRSTESTTYSTTSYFTLASSVYY